MVGENVAATVGEREFLPQSLLEFFIGPGELNAADAFVGSGDENSTERGVRAGVPNSRRYGAPPIFGRLHAEFRGGSLI